MFSRRESLAAAAALSLGGCTLFQGQQSAPSTQTVLAYVASISAAATDVVAEIATLAGVSANDVANIKASLAAVTAAAQQIEQSADLGSAAAVSNLRLIVSGVNAIVVAAAAIPVIPASVRVVLTALGAALPPIEAAAGLAAAPAAGAVYDPATAKAILDGYHAARMAAMRR
jgi:hypothetical protein